MFFDDVILISKTDWNQYEKEYPNNLEYKEGSVKGVTNGNLISIEYVRGGVDVRIATDHFYINGKKYKTNQLLPDLLGNKDSFVFEIPYKVVFRPNDLVVGAKSELNIKVNNRLHRTVTFLIDR